MARPLTQRKIREEREQRKAFIVTGTTQPLWVDDNAARAGPQPSLMDHLKPLPLRAADVQHKGAVVKPTTVRSTLLIPLLPESQDGRDDCHRLRDRVHRNVEHFTVGSVFATNSSTVRT